MAEPMMPAPQMTTLKRHIYILSAALLTSLCQLLPLLQGVVAYRCGGSAVAAGSPDPACMHHSMITVAQQHRVQTQICMQCMQQLWTKEGQAHKPISVSLYRHDVCYLLAG